MNSMPTLSCYRAMYVGGELAWSCVVTKMCESAVVKCHISSCFVTDECKVTLILTGFQNHSQFLFSWSFIGLNADQTGSYFKFILEGFSAQ